MPRAPISPDMIRAYASGELAWATLRDAGVGYEDVLAGLGELGLRPPVAPMAGPNVDARRRGLDLLRDLLDHPAA
jgi:hypothetical protein